jgi:hypothetical protein
MDFVFIDSSWHAVAATKGIRGQPQAISPPSLKLRRDLAEAISFGVGRPSTLSCQLAEKTLSQPMGAVELRCSIRPPFLLSQTRSCYTAERENLLKERVSHAAIGA